VEFCFCHSSNSLQVTAKMAEKVALGLDGLNPPKCLRGTILFGKAGSAALATFENRPRPGLAVFKAFSKLKCFSG
jgi:hypothetical protein